ncbi:acyl dehydratase [Bradyrhizobium sp. GM2.2]
MFDNSAVGDTFAGRLAATSWHLITGAALFGDESANHVDVVHSAKNRFGARVVHGFTITGMMSSLDDATIGHSKDFSKAKHDSSHRCPWTTMWTYAGR